MTYSAITIANHFINKALEENDTDMTPMKVLKLTYIAHGWHWGLFSMPLLHEAVQAWQYGPVIPSVYHVFKTYGNSRITEPYFNGDCITDTRIQQFLNRIWEVYKGYSGWQLSAITHRPNTPWAQVWAGGNNYNVQIPDAVIAEHYRQLARKKG